MNGDLNNDQKFIKQLTEIIVANIGDANFGIEELAHESGISRQSLNQRLRSITKKPINQFIRETRLEKALEILQNGNVTASEVAYRVGFSSPAYFSTCFREFFGYPPGQVRKVIHDNSKESESIPGTEISERRKLSRLKYILISSGILIIAIIVFLMFHFNPVKSTDYHRNIVKDIDGNVYHSLKIGNQIWLGEDLKTTKYNDGTSIPYVPDASEWKSLHSAAYCWPNEKDSNRTKYGALYNWYTTDLGKLCPVGWHVSTDKDWDRLVDYCGGWEIAGGKLKEAGTEHWDSPNIGATNEFGFNALPIGGRGRDLGYWCPPRCGDFRSLCSDRTWIYLTESHASEACCVRCVKNK